jgi:hypothetical protein
MTVPIGNQRNIAAVASQVRNRIGLEIGTDVQAYNASLASIAGLTTSANQLLYTTASNTYATASLTAAGRALLDDADASAQRTTLGLAIGTHVQAYDAGLASIAGLTTAADRMLYTTALDTYAVATLTAAGRAILDDADASAQRTTLGVVIGTDVQAYNSKLADIAALTPTDGQVITGNGTTWTVAAIPAYNEAAVNITGGSIAGITDLAVADGGTGASTAGGARTNLGLVIGADVQAYNAALASIAGLTTSANQLIYAVGSNTYATASLTAAGLALLDDADAAAQRTTLGLGSAATTAASAYATAAQGTKADSALQSAAIGSSIQAYDADLAAIAALTPSDGDVLTYDTGAWTAAAPSGGTPGLVPIGSLLTPSAVAALDISLTGGYQEYIIKFWALKPATDAVGLYLRTSTNGGSTFDSGASDYSWSGALVKATGSFRNATNQAQIEITDDQVGFGAVGNSTNENGVYGEIHIFAPSDAAYTLVSSESSYMGDDGTIRGTRISGVRQSAADVDAIRLLFSSGNITSGKVQLYGVSTA